MFSKAGGKTVGKRLPAVDVDAGPAGGESHSSIRN